MKALRGLLLSSFTALLVACAGGASDSKTPVGTAPPPPEPEAAADLPASAVAQMKVLMDEKAARTPAQRKISSQLLYAKTQRFAVFKQTAAQRAATPDNGLRSLMQYDAKGRVLADVKGDVDAGLQLQIEVAGGEVVRSSSQYKSARAWLPLATLESLAEQASVRSIRPAFAATTDRADSPRAGAKFGGLTYEQRVAATQRAVQAWQNSGGAKVVPVSDGPIANLITETGIAVSEGSKAHLADSARKFYNTDGSGVRVGVLSDSDDLKEESIASGDLPADTITIPGQDGRPGSGEGTAMMEIVHDVAPGAKLIFASAFNSPEDFADNIRRLRFEYHADIIIDDVQYYFESPYQDDIVAGAVDDVTADGALYFSSAGNSGNQDDGTSGTWEGDFKSGGTLVTLPGGYKVLDFGRKVISNRIEFGGGPLQLHWSDPAALEYPQSSNDYDLFLLSADLREVLLASTDVQDGDDLAWEYLGFNIPSEFRVVIAAKTGAAPRALRLELTNGEFGLATTGSVKGHAAAKKAFAVAAVDVANAADGIFLPGAITPVEIYSSDGNRRLFYSRTGAPIGGGQPLFATSAGEVRKKPDVTAADGVSTTLPSSSGLNPFFGTSAAAPHAGAIAALIKSAVPSATAGQIYGALRNGALDIEAAGVDIDSGNGIVLATRGLQQIGAKPAVYLDLGTVTATPTSGSSVKPGGGGSLSIQLINNGGAAATGVKTTLTSVTPGVTITSATSQYRNIPAGTSAFNLTPFVISVGQSVPCGTKLQLTLSVTFTGRGTNPTAFNIPIQTGSAGTTVLTAYSGAPVDIPDDDPAGVDIPLAISAGGIFDLGVSVDGTTCTTDEGATTVGVDHSWSGDLKFSLRSPGGKSVTFINRAGGPLQGGNNFCQTNLKDGEANSIQDVTEDDAPFTGSFSPANPLKAFQGDSANGTWTLNVSDGAFLDTGTVRNFSVKVTGFQCTN
jgi:subtilisin-like proprotein convertase family protein